MLPRHRKIPRLDLINVLRHGTPMTGSHFRLKFLPNLFHQSRFSVVVSNKIVPHAHARNRLKRMVYRDVAGFSSSYDIVISLTKSVVNLKNEDLNSQINQALSKIPVL